MLGEGPGEPCGLILNGFGRQDAVNRGLITLRQGELEAKVGDATGGESGEVKRENAGYEVGYRG